MSSPQHNPHQLLHDVGPVEVLNLEPVDAVTVATLMDNALDLFMPDQGPAHRVGPQPRPARRCSVMTDRQVPDALIAERGLSMLVTVSKAGRKHRVLFDVDASPDGVVENMRRLDVDPTSIEAIVRSHGHLDHTAGLDGLLRVLDPTGMPVLIHPHFWRRRRAVFPGREPFALPTTSATAPREVGFDILENQQPNFLLDRSVLITGEVPRVSGYEPGFPIQQAWIDEIWQPDPLVLDDQALIVDVRGKGTDRDHRLRPRRRGQHQPLRPATDRRTATARAARCGAPPQRPLFRTPHPSGTRRPGPARSPVLVPAHCTGWRASTPWQPGSARTSYPTASAPGSPSEPATTAPDSRPPGRRAMPRRFMILQ